MTIDEDGEADRISINQATPAPSNNTSANVGDGRIAIEGERASIQNEYQAPEGEVSDSERCDTDVTSTHSTPTASKNVDAHELSDSKDLEINDDEDDKREHAIDRIVGHMQTNEKTHYVVR